jgi:ribonuclease D
MTNYLHKGDLPSEVEIRDSVAIDTETLGLNNQRDKLCLVQLSTGDGNAHIIQLDRSNYSAPNLVRIFEEEKILKIFHFARFDVSVIKRYLGCNTNSVYCTKISSKLVRTYTDSHGLKDLCSELLGKKISKTQQSSDWGAAELSKEQISYAAYDVLYLHALKEKLDIMLEREGRKNLAQNCFNFIQTRSDLDLAGWPEIDIFAHK